MNDRRDQQLHFRVSKQELERIWSKMESSGILSIGSYLRKMALDGYCLHLDLQELRRMAYLLQMCSNNLNQYAKAANENGKVYAADLEDLRTQLDELICISKQILSRLADILFFALRLWLWGYILYKDKTVGGGGHGRNTLDRAAQK